MARGERERPDPPLPAPYRNPWSGLAESLRAVVADRRLALQRLWRRNRDGDLPLPGLWPRDLAPLFWPLLLSAVLALLIGLGGWLFKRTTLRPSPAAAVGSAAIAPRTASEQEESLPGAALMPQARPAAPNGMEPRPGPGEPPMETGPARGASTEPGLDSPSASRSGPDSGPGRSDAALPDTGAGSSSRAETTSAELRLDPLLELLGQGEDTALLLEARPDPAASRLSLTLAPAAEALPQAELLERAQRWQQLAREAGYERLELRDPQGRLRGRGALVGSGMILLAPIPAA